MEGLKNQFNDRNSKFTSLEEISQWQQLEVKYVKEMLNYLELLGVLYIEEWGERIYIMINFLGTEKSRDKELAERVEALAEELELMKTNYKGGRPYV